MFSAIVVGDINIYTNATTGITAGPCVLVPRRMAENNRSNTSSKIEIDERERAMKTSSTNRQPFFRSGLSGRSSTALAVAMTAPNLPDA